MLPLHCCLAGLLPASDFCTIVDGQSYVVERHSRSSLYFSRNVDASRFSQPFEEKFFLGFPHALELLEKLPILFVE